MQHSTSTAISPAEKDRNKTKLMAGGKGIDRLAWFESSLTPGAELGRQGGERIVLSLFLADTDPVPLSKSPTSSISPSGLLLTNPINSRLVGYTEVIC